MPTAISATRRCAWPRTRSSSTTTALSSGSRASSPRPKRWRSLPRCPDMEPMPRHRCMGGEVKNMRALVLAIGALVIVAACGRVPGGQVTPGDYKLYVAASTSSSQQLSIIDSRSHSIELNMPLGTPSPNWTHLYTVQGNLLADLDPRTGAVLHKLQLPGSYQLPPATLSGVPGGLSPNGRWLVLEAPDRTSSTLPNSSHLLVVDTTYAKKPQRIELNGDFRFDAINDGGSRVYLIEYLSTSEY